MTIKAVIFDIDGTLANTLPICIETYRDVLQSQLHRPVQTEEITRYFGIAEEGILRQYLPDEIIPAMMDEYFRIYDMRHEICTEPFPGMLPLIQRLKIRGITVAVVTGKGERGAGVTLRKIGLLPYLTAVETGFDEGPNKPESLRRMLKRLNLQPNEAIYVGDSAYDIESANAAGMSVIGAAWAATTDISANVEKNALRVFHSIPEFADWLEQAL